jgi:hypothetical protein
MLNKFIEDMRAPPAECATRGSRIKSLARR